MASFTAPLTDTHSEQLAAIFRALGDPTRLRLLHALRDRELPVCELATIGNISESAASHQLSVLRALRIVRRRKAGRHVHYTLDDDHVRQLLAYGLAHVEDV